MNEDLDALCAQWQSALRLRDWDVDAALVEPTEMRDPKSLGECSYDLRKKTAAVRISTSTADAERTLVHELLHLHLAPLDFFVDDKLGEMALEQAVHPIATLLVELVSAARMSRQEYVEVAPVANSMLTTETTASSTKKRRGKKTSSSV